MIRAVQMYCKQNTQYHYNETNSAPLQPRAAMVLNINEDNAFSDTELYLCLSIIIALFEGVSVTAATAAYEIHAVHLLSFIISNLTFSQFSSNCCPKQR